MNLAESCLISLPRQGRGLVTDHKGTVLLKCLVP